MTLKEAIKQGVEAHDLEILAKVVNQLWGKLNYLQMAEFFRRCAGVDLEEFEALMWELEQK